MVLTFSNKTSITRLFNLLTDSQGFNLSPDDKIFRFIHIKLICRHFNSFPNDKSLYWSELKAFADKKISVT